MNQLQIINQNGKLLADSRGVAVMVGKQHKDLLRDIRNYSDILTSAELRSSDFFVANEYEDGKGEKRPCYYLTRKGCDMVANKMTGEKGVLFTAAYVTKFEEMESQLNPFNNLSPELKAIFTVDTKVQRLESKITEVETKVERQITLDSGQQRRVQQAIAKKVCSIEPDQTERGDLFRQIHKEIKDRWQVPSYKDILRQDMQGVLNYIDAWVPIRRTA